MPIKRRLREDYWLVSRDDDALDQLSPRDAATYMRTYDYRVIERYLAEHPDKRPTRFRCKPLAIEWQDRAGNLLPSDCWRLFADHVTAIENLLDENGREIRVEPQGEGASRRIPDRFREDGTIDMTTFVEIASAIYARGTTADSVPFGSPDTSLEWQRTRGWRNHVRAADIALLIGSASAKTNRPSPSSVAEMPDGSSECAPSIEGGE
jgi:hypothetical protein